MGHKPNGILPNRNQIGNSAVFLDSIGHFLKSNLGFIDRHQNLFGIGFAVIHWVQSDPATDLHIQKTGGNFG